jgi:2-polyprenyl-3-methyl-5-hydroxy-6-metoxy-1,4-benzoquinol methylase
VTKCYLCGGDDIGFRDGSARDSVEVVIRECRSCGLVFLENSPASDISYYSTSKMHEDDCCADDLKGWLINAAENDRRRFDSLREAILGKKVLDFGCGAGGFLELAKDVADIADGFEVEQRLQKYFTDRDYRVFSKVEELPTSYYDFVTMFHVLEHIADPRATLINLKSQLKEGGKVVIEVPSASDALLTLYDCESYKNFIYWSCHLYLFTRHAIAELVKQAGYTVDFINECQRYSLANHLHWLSKGKPGGQKQWWFIQEDKTLASLYNSRLAGLGLADTLVVGLSV